MALIISEAHLDEIREHGAREYPSECCGALVGAEANGIKRVGRIAPLRNIRRDRARAEELLPLSDAGRESERNRFLIDPQELYKLLDEVRREGLDVVGYYHSHPDHPARPSEYDRAHAFPWYSYVIIGIEDGKAGDFASWELREDRSQFDEEAIQVSSAVARL